MLDKKGKHERCECKSCICKVLLNIVKQQRKEKSFTTYCSLETKEPDYRETIPLILQTPYGHPYFTWGNIGTKDCFVTVFFKVIKVDCKKKCAVFQLLKPNKSILDPDTECVETSSICKADYVIETEECVLVDLNCYSAVKLISPNFVKRKKSYSY